MQDGHKRGAASQHHPPLPHWPLQHDWREPAVLVNMQALGFEGGSFESVGLGYALDASGRRERGGVLGESHARRNWCDNM